MAAVLLLVGWNSLRSEEPASAPLQDRSGGSYAKGGTAEESDDLEVAAGGRSIVVDVSGAVNRPGVYRFRHGQRVIDAIRRAGGPSEGAFAAGINRAALLSDGQQVVVPIGVATAAGGAGAVSAAPAAGAVAADVPISLGSATQAQLEEIEGIGPVTATAILEFRDGQGGVSSIEDLDQVTGIGPVTMEALKSRLQP